MAEIDLGKVVPERGVDYWTEEDKQEVIEETKAGIHIPTELSELNEDSTHRTVTDIEKETWNNKQNTSDESLETEEKSIVGAINELKSDTDTLGTDKQNKQDTTLSTISKLVIGAINEIFASVGGIQALIPSQASASNQVADKDFVNSSLNSITAFYITKNAQGDPFATKAELTSATTFYSGGEVRVPTRNDYAFVLEDESKQDPETLVKPSTRYIFQNNQWEYQYTVNKTSLTANQLAAINSGITQTLVALISTNQTNIATILEDYIKSTDYATTTTGGTIKVSGTYGTGITSGMLRSTIKTDSEYRSANDYLIIGKGTLENVLTGKNINDVSNEEWVFTMSDNTTVTKNVKVGA